MADRRPAGETADRRCRQGAVTGSGDETLRLDKWLWHARFCKTRSLATMWCAEGKIRVDGAVVTKAHFAVRPGQVLSFVQGRYVRVVKVLALGSRRGPPAEAQGLYEDLAPPSPETALPPPDAAAAGRQPGSGRPTKKERRALDKLLRDD